MSDLYLKPVLVIKNGDTNGRTSERYAMALSPLSAEDASHMGTLITLHGDDLLEQIRLAVNNQLRVSVLIEFAQHSPINPEKHIRLTNDPAQTTFEDLQAKFHELSHPLQSIELVRIQLQILTNGELPIVQIQIDEAAKANCIQQQEEYRRNIQVAMQNPLWLTTQTDNDGLGAFVFAEIETALHSAENLQQAMQSTHSEMATCLSDEGLNTNYWYYSDSEDGKTKYLLGVFEKIDRELLLSILDNMNRATSSDEGSEQDWDPISEFSLSGRNTPEKTPNPLDRIAQNKPSRGASSTSPMAAATPTLFHYSTTGGGMVKDEVSSNYRSKTVHNNPSHIR